MKAAPVLKAVHTVSLDYEQLLILDVGSQARPKVLFQGVWLSDPLDPRACADAGDAAIHGLTRRAFEDFVGAARGVLAVPAHTHTRQGWTDALRSRLHVFLARTLGTHAWKG